MFSESTHITPPNRITAVQDNRERRKNITKHVTLVDEKPVVQALGVTAPDLPPVPGKDASIGRDHEYVRHGTLSSITPKRCKQQPSAVIDPNRISKSNGSRRPQGASTQPN